MLDFGEAVRSYYRNYLNPHGRSQRSAYWWVLLFQVILYFVLATIFIMSDGGPDFLEIAIEGSDSPFEVSVGLEEAFESVGISGKLSLLLLMIFAFVNFLPDIMLHIRRFHDLNQTGWLVLVFKVVGMIPLIGKMATLANLIWFCYPGTIGPNRFGADPLQRETNIFE